MTEQQNRVVRVLVVDDEPSNRALAERVLVANGYAVDTASDGDEALKLTSERARYDLFVLDIRMPGMEGTELAVRIRQRQPDAKILFFTAYSEQLFERKRLLDENEAFIEKPVSIRELAETASLLLYGHLRGPG